jgi:hypothetical protein
MPRAVVLNTASKNNAGGGTFADALAANAGDSLSVANFNTGGAKIIEMWGIDSDSVAELEVIYTRPESTHDQQHGVRFNIPALKPGGAGTVAAHNMLPGLVTIDLYKSDVPQFLVTSSAGDDILVSWQTLYDDLPGVQGVFASWAQVQSMQKSIVGINCVALASATEGLYGAQRAIQADDSRLHANTWYALLGATVRTVCTTISLLGPDWGGQRIGFPAGVLGLDTPHWFVDQSIKWNLPLIPCFNSNNANGNIVVQVADGEANTSPNIDFLMYELTGMPGF